MLQEGSEQARCPYPGSLVGAHLHLARAPSWSLSTAHNSARNTHLPISQKGKMGSGSSSPCICPRPPAGRRTQVGLGAPPMAALCGVEVCALTPSYAGPLLPRGWGGREAGPTHPLCGLPQCSAQSVTAPAGDLLWYLGTRASVFGEMAPRKTKSVAGDLCSCRLSPQPRSELLLTTTLPGTPHWVREATEPGPTAVLWAPRAWPSLPGPGSPWAVPAGNSTHSTWLNPHKAERMPTGPRRGLLQGRQVTGSGSQLPPEVTPVRAPTPPGALSSSER